MSCTSEACVKCFVKQNRDCLLSKHALLCSAFNLLPFLLITYDCTVNSFCLIQLLTTLKNVVFLWF